MKSKISLGGSLLIIIIAGIVFTATIIFFPNGSYTKPVLKTVGQNPKIMSYHTNIIKDTEENANFRRVLFTGTNSQLVVMSIPPGTDVGAETHKFTEQTLFFLLGTGEGELDGKKFPIVPGDVVVVVPGTEHNFTNTGTTDMKIYTVYAPPNHIDGRIHKTKADADADTADEAVGETAPLK